MRLSILALLLIATPALAQTPDSPLAALAPLVGPPWQATVEADGRTVTDVRTPGAALPPGFAPACSDG